MENAKNHNPSLSTILLYHWIVGNFSSPSAFREAHLFLVEWKETEWNNELIESLPEELFLAMKVNNCLDFYKLWEIATYVQAHLSRKEQQELLSYLQSREVLLELP